jgi:hypothetical protein
MILHVVERAYQGTLEEQDDTALWLIEALARVGGEHAVLLRGPAVGYAVRGASVGELSIAGVRAGNPARLDRDLERMSAGGVAIFGVRADLERRGIEPAACVRVEWIDSAAQTGLFRRATRVLAW